MRVMHLMPPPTGPEARRHRLRLAAWLLWAVALMSAAGVTRAASAPEDIEQFPSTQMSIRTHAGLEWFSVWIADSQAREQQGLMFVRWLPPDHGMLFPQAAPQVMTMWMKNTLIPLDMLFIDVQGRIVYIRENTTPQSQDLISTPTAVKAVLELAGGVCAKLGIHVGDRIEHRLFGAPPAGPVRN
jgi:uncharacterized membrane protein (UPF0127 family)